MDLLYTLKEAMDLKEAMPGVLYEKELLFGFYRYWVQVLVECPGVNRCVEYIQIRMHQLNHWSTWTGRSNDGGASFDGDR